MEVKNKKNVPIWAWIVMGILAVITIILFISNLNSVSLEDYSSCFEKYSNKSLEIFDASEKYHQLNLDFLRLLICYQKGLPTCEPLIEKYGNASMFTQKQYLQE